VGFFGQKHFPSPLFTVSFMGWLPGYWSFGGGHNFYAITYGQSGAISVYAVLYPVSVNHKVKVKQPLAFSWCTLQLLAAMPTKNR
jgi:hypothetical protein